jgi:hypothetical protein
LAIRVKVTLIDLYAKELTKNDTTKYALRSLQRCGVATSQPQPRRSGLAAPLCKTFSPQRYPVAFSHPKRRQRKTNKVNQLTEFKI